MTVPDSLKIRDIAQHPDFKYRIRQRLLKFVDYTEQSDAPNKAEVLADAQKVWTTDLSLETMGMLVLNDQALLVKTDPSGGGSEITDAELSGRLEPNLHVWVGYLP